MATRLQSAIIPVRFLTMLGHLLAVVLFFFARRDGIVVSLPFDYTSEELLAADQLAVAALVLSFICFGVEAFGFLGGFTMFDEGLGLLHILCHFVGGVLVSVMVVQKSDYRWFWYVLAFFSALPALCELAAILSVVMLKKRRW